MKRTLVLLGTMALTATACVQVQQPTRNPAALGRLELGFNVSADGQRFSVTPQAVLPDNAISALSKVAGQATDDGTFRYIYATFDFTNNSGGTFDNLTLYAYNQAANSAGGTAIKNLVNFGGGDVATSAQSLLPTHGMTASGSSTTVLPTREDFQAFSSTEASAVDTAATPAVISQSDTVLEYGFVARAIDNAGNLTGGRSIAAGAKGRITAAYKLPIGSVTGTAYSFVATFVLANESAIRITRSPEETTTAAATRASSLTASEVVLIGQDADTAPGSIRLINSRIGTNPTYLLNNSCAAPSVTAIPAVQGSGTSSPLSGSSVIVDGVVTGNFVGTSKLNGFFLQDPNGDSNPSTSDGIFVNSTVSVNAGQLLRVSGSVAETNNRTQLTNTTITDCGFANVPNPATLNMPVNALTDLEALEGMKVTVPDTMTVTSTFNLGNFGELRLSSGGRLFNPSNTISAVGDITTPGTIRGTIEANKKRVLVLNDGRAGAANADPDPIPFISSAPLTLNDTRRAGDTVTGLTGFLNFDFNQYVIEVTNPNDVVFSAANPRSSTPKAIGGSLRVAAANVENFFLTPNNVSFTTSASNNINSRGAVNAADFARQKNKVVANLQNLNADIIGLIEIQNDNQSSLNSQNFVTGITAIEYLVNELNAAIPGNTDDYAINAAPNGGYGSDAIKVAFIYRSARVQPIGAARSDANTIFQRPPSAQTFRTLFNGANDGSLTVIVNHFKSKGSGTGDDADFGHGRSNYNRLQQARQLKEFISTLTDDPGEDPDVLVIGDLNAYGAEDPINYLASTGVYTVNAIGGSIPTTLPNARAALSSLNQCIPLEDRYSYQFDGQFGYLDHALSSASLGSCTAGTYSGQITGMTEWHINSDEPNAFDYSSEANTTYRASDTTPYLSSDHDPLVIGLNLTPDNTSGGGAPACTGLSVTPTTASVAVGATTQLNAALSPAGCTSSGSITWTTADANIASVNPSTGLVTGVAAGNPIAITAMAGGLMGSSSITVTASVAASIVISQIYGAGGNSGATFNSDFVELHNRTSSAISLSNYSIQYASATGTGSFAPLALTGSIPAGGYYLVQLSGGASGTALPTPDLTGALALSASAGKVILANTTSAVACNGGSTLCSVAQLAQIVDLVGYGTANFFEGTAAPAPSTINSISRAANGCTDSNNNSADFTVITVAPRNSSDAAFVCP